MSGTLAPVAAMPRVTWEILISVAIAYAAVLALVYLFQARLVFYPEIGRDATLTPQSYGLSYEAAEIPTADGEKLHAWWVPAENARGAVLLFHGNAGNISHRLDYLLMFHRLRYTTLIVDYRGYGKSTGSPTEAGTYRDAEAAWDYLRHGRLAKPEDVVIAGESLGGAVAAWLAAKVSLIPSPSLQPSSHALLPKGEGNLETPLSSRERGGGEGWRREPDSLPLREGEGSGVRAGPRAVLLFSTFTSATDLGAQVYWFLPVRMISRIGYDNLENLKRIRSPVLIAHSRDDDVVPFTHGKRLYEAAGEPKAFVEMRGGHNDGFIFARTEWVAQLAAFLDKHSGK